jgi:hypothetical protein
LRAKWISKQRLANELTKTAAATAKDSAAESRREAQAAEATAKAKAAATAEAEARREATAKAKAEAEAQDKLRRQLEDAEAVALEKWFAPSALGEQEVGEGRLGLQDLTNHCVDQRIPMFDSGRTFNNRGYDRQNGSVEVRLIKKLEAFGATPALVWAGKRKREEEEEKKQAAEAERLRVENERLEEVRAQKQACADAVARKGETPVTARMLWKHASRSGAGAFGTAALDDALANLEEQKDGSVDETLLELCRKNYGMSTAGSEVDGSEEMVKTEWGEHAFFTRRLYWKPIDGLEGGGGQRRQ